MSVFKIDEERIKIYKNIFDSDYNDFLSKKMMFENSYICTNNEPSLQNIKSTLKRMYDDIEKSYSKIKKWWNEYIEEYEKIESNLNKTIDNIGLGVFDIISKELENIYVKTANNIVYGSNVATSAINEVLENIPKNTDSVTEEDNIHHGGGGFHVEGHSAAAFNKYNSTSNSSDEEININESEYYNREINREISILKYNSILDSDDYKKFKEKYTLDDLYNLVNKEANELTANDDHFNKTNLLIGVEYYKKNNLDISGLVSTDYIVEGYGLLSAIDMYNYMTDNEKEIFNYLYFEKGKTEADKYIDEIIIDEINQNKGAIKAQQEIEEFALYYAYQKDGGIEGIPGLIASYNFVSIKGLSGGLKSFFRGLENSINDNKHLTEDEYAASIFLQYLRLNTDLYDEKYEFDSAIGNMLPSIAASAIISKSFGAKAIGETLGSILMGISSGGNAYHEALVNGHDSFYARLYGLTAGFSEAITERFLGGIPGISAVDAGILKAMLREGLQEAVQEWFDAGAKAFILGEEINLDDLKGSSIKSFIMGALVSGYLNGAENVVKFTIDNAHYEIPFDDLKQIAQDINNDNSGFLDLSAFSKEAREIKKLNKEKERINKEIISCQEKLINFNQYDNEIYNALVNTYNYHGYALPDATKMYNLINEVKIGNYNHITNTNGWRQYIYNLLNSNPTYVNYIYELNDLYKKQRINDLDIEIKKYDGLEEKYRNELEEAIKSSFDGNIGTNELNFLVMQIISYSQYYRIPENNGWRQYIIDLQTKYRNDCEVLTNYKFEKYLLENNINITNEIDPFHGFQLNLLDLGQYKGIFLREDVQGQEDMKKRMEAVNKLGYLDPIIGDYLRSLVNNNEYDIYIKTVKSSGVDSIVKYGIEMLGNSSLPAFVSTIPKSLGEIKLSDSVTKIDGMFQLICALKGANGLSQGNKQIDGTIILKVPKGSTAFDICKYDETMGHFVIDPKYNIGFIGCDINGNLDTSNFNYK